MTPLYEVAGMRAAVYHGREDVRVEETERRPVGPDDVEIAVAFCGLCGSDVHEYGAGPIAIPDDEPHPLTGETLPLVVGHEFSGTVTQTGDRVDRFEAGDRVTVNPAIWCGDCRYCHAGDYHLCAVGGSIGLSGWGGGLAERAVVPASQVVPVPDGVGLEAAALAEPYAVALHAVRESSLRPGDAAAVFGAGPIGLAVAQVSRLAGSDRTFVSEPRAGRRSVADALGFRTIDPAAAHPPREISAATDGGVAVAYEAAGVEAALNQAVRTASKGGEVTLISVFEESASVQPNYVMMAERTVRGSLAYETGPRAADGEFADVLAMFEDGRLDPEPLVTDRIDLSEVVESGFEPLADPGERVKVLVSP